MNPLTLVNRMNKMNEMELKMGSAATLKKSQDISTSWHNMYRDSSWIFIGGLNYDLSEGDVISVFSQYGEIVNINLVRDKGSGKSKGFAFLCYEDQRSTILAVDNLNGIKLVGRIIRVDHVEEYRVPGLKQEDAARKETTTRKRNDNSNPPLEMKRDERDTQSRVAQHGGHDSDEAEEGDDSIDANDVQSIEALIKDDLVKNFVRENGCAPEMMQKIAQLQAKKEELLNLMRDKQAKSAEKTSSTSSHNHNLKLRHHESLHQSSDKRRHQDKKERSHHNRRRESRSPSIKRKKRNLHQYSSSRRQSPNSTSARHHQHRR